MKELASDKEETNCKECGTLLDRINGNCSGCDEDCYNHYLLTQKGNYVSNKKTKRNKE